MSASFLPDLFLQCGDAITYMAHGESCALENACYDDIRPGGTGYWFSWPIRLGLPFTALVYAHIALLLLSSWLAALALTSVAGSTHTKSARGIFLAPTSLAIHLLFLWPTMLTSLSDTPAALFMLIGLWLLLLSCSKTGMKSYLLLGIGALSISLAAWIRAFYFHPMLAGVAIGFAGFVMQKKSKAVTLASFALLFPILQISHTYNSTGKLAYLNSTQSNSWQEIHLNSANIGYDTILPYYGYFYPPKYCEITRGLLDSVMIQHYSSLACLLGNRIAFYLATYRESTYLHPGTKNHLFINTMENIGDTTNWLSKNVEVQRDVAEDPFGGMTAERMAVQSMRPEDNAYLAQWVLLPSNTEYSFSVWLWSDHPGEVDIAFADHSNNVPLGRKTVSLTATPQRFFVSGTTRESGLYSVNIGHLPFAYDGVTTPALPRAFYAWGSELEEGPSMTAYAGMEPLNPDKIRQWHPALLAANMLAITIALLFLLRTRRTFLSHPAYWAVISVMFFSFAQALLIIPEQRFMAACMIFIWLLATTELLARLNSLGLSSWTPERTHLTE